MIVHNVRQAALTLRRSPGFSLGVIVLLAIAVAGPTFVYSVAEALLLRPIPYSRPESLYLVSTTFSPEPTELSESAFVSSWDLYERLRDQHPSLGLVAAYSGSPANILGAEWSERLQVGAVSPEFFPLTGVRPCLGRGFSAVDFHPGSQPVALITDGIWRRHFGAASDVVGRVIEVDDRPHTVVGVLPPDFRSVDELETGGETWQDKKLGLIVPARGDPTAVRANRTGSFGGVRVLVRLAAGRSLLSARRQVAAVGAQMPKPSMLSVNLGYTLTSLTTALSRGVPERIAMLALAVAVLLLVACANAANLMLERGERRRREIGIRAALGATTRQLVGEALLEASILGVTGGLVGLGFSAAAVRFTSATGEAVLTGLGQVAVSKSVLAFALAASIAAALLTALAPCAHLLRTDLARWLPATGASQQPAARLSSPSVLVVAQVSLSVGLVVVGGLLVKDFARLSAVNLGYDPDGVLSAEVSVSRVRHGRDGREFLDTLLERVRSLPGVQEAALASPGPGLPVYSAMSARVEGYDDTSLACRWVSPSFFTLLGVPILAGRPFMESGRAGPESVIVNRAFAEKYWGSPSDAIGRHVILGTSTSGQAPLGGRLFTVVAVSQDVRNAWGQATPEMYLTYASAHNFQQLDMTLLIRLAGGQLAGMLGPLSRVVQQVDPYQPLANVRPLSDIVSARLARRRALLTLMMVFSALVTFLAAVGIYSILACSVTHRTREIGIRLAVGGTPRDVLGLILRQTLGMLARGVTAALPLTLIVTWLFAAQLFGISDTSWSTYAWAVGLVFAVGVLASVVPAWRATRIDATVALRDE